jgi:hypothetical protein
VVAFGKQVRQSDVDARTEIGLAGLSSAAWRKSSYSACNGNCVEVAVHRDLIGVRDTKDEGRGPVLIFDGAAWRSFIDSLKGGT